MTKGVATEVEIFEAFRADYLFTGNASKSGRTISAKLGISPVMSRFTARDIANRLNADESFAEDRRQMRAGFLDECILARQEVLRLALRRAKAKDADNYGVAGVLDKRPDWAKVVLDAERNAHALAKVETGNGGGSDKPTELHITIAGPGSASGDPAPE